MRRWVTTALLVAACEPNELPPLGEAIVFVDTDLPVPRVASRLRVDVHLPSGEWLESREIHRPDPRDWPVSFSVQAADDRDAREVVLRLRVDGGRSRDYRGERRLLRDGADITPALEPEPTLAVDRLLRIRLVPGVRRRVAVVARAACAGTTVTEGPAWEGCTENENVREPAALVDTEMMSDAEVTSSINGTAARSTCPIAPADDTRCIEGGAFVLGDDPAAYAPDLPQSPVSIALSSAFAMDRDEVTVAHYRRLLAAGFIPPEPPGDDADCSFSVAPSDHEDFALTCVSWATARALCVFEHGDLPTEAQWEYAATSAGRTGKSEFPWGDALPTCDRAVYGRLTLAGAPGACSASAQGPQPIVFDGDPMAPADLTPSGVHGMGGGVAEWVRDVAAPYSAPCWARTKIDPGCLDGGGAHVIRGGSWAAPPLALRATSRLAATAGNAFIGMRCVYTEAR